MTPNRLWTATALLVMCWLVIATFLVSRHEFWELKLFALFSAVVTVITLWLHHYSLPQKKVRDLQALAEKIKTRKPNNYTPMPEDNIAEEIRPLVQALNHFLQREADQLYQQHIFTSQASHELRTPLAGIRLQTQIAQRTSDLEQRKAALDKVVKSIDRSTHLVDQLLALSRLSIIRQDEDLSFINLGVLVQQVTNTYSKVITQKGIQLIIQLNSPQQEEFTFGNNDQLHVLLKNLLLNAIDYTPEGGQIRVSWQRVGNKWLFTVEDSGPGISQDQFLSIQQPFQKGLDGKKQGSGLGLAIARRIAELNDSSLLLSQSPLGGLSIGLWLPFSTDRPKP